MVYAATAKSQGGGTQKSIWNYLKTESIWAIHFSLGWYNVANQDPFAVIEKDLPTTNELYGKLCLFLLEFRTLMI